MPIPSSVGSGLRLGRSAGRERGRRHDEAPQRRASRAVAGASPTRAALRASPRRRGRAARPRDRARFRRRRSAEELPVRPRAPLQPDCGETRGELVVAIVLPRSELGLARRLPVAEGTADGLREERRRPGRRRSSRELPEHGVRVRAERWCGRRAAHLSADANERREQLDGSRDRAGRSRPTSRSATTCGSACTVSRCCTRPHGTPADSSAPIHSSDRRSANEAAIRAVSSSLAARTDGSPGTRSGASIVASSRSKSSRNASPLREVEAGDRDEAVGRLEAAVVRVHGDTACDLVRARVELRPIRGKRRVAVCLAVEPDEILELDRQRGSEERHLDELALPGLACADERGQHPGREQEAGGEVGHRDAAGADRHGVARASVRREQAGARLRDQVVGRRVRERPATRRTS